MEKDHTLFGQKAVNTQTDELGIVLYTWKNTYADAIIDMACWVNQNGKVFQLYLDNLTPIED
jgi:hypothetical protein